MRLRLKALFRRRQLERDLEDELAFHLAQRGSALESRTRFGNPTVWKERTRDLWTFPILETLAQDLRYAGRVLGKSRIFTVVAILSLALGIGATTAIFSLMDALLLRALPVRDPEQLALFDGGIYCGTYQAYQFFRDTNRFFSGIFATSGPRDINIQAAEPERARVELVTGSYFPVLGVPPALGRTLTPDDDRVPGGHPVAVLSFAYWERRFHRDPQIAGKVLRISRFPFTVIGVAAPSFSGVTVGDATDVWIPATMQREAMPDADRLTYRPRSGVWSWLQIFGRLQPGVRLQDAQPSIDVLWTRWVRQEVEASGNPQSPESLRRLGQSSFRLRPASRGISSLRRTYTFPLQILLAATGLVLLIACANLANLLLARGGARSREIGVRLSLGAARGRLVRQMLTESALLSISGAVLGLLIAQWGDRLLLHMVSRDPEALPLDAGLDWRVVGFTTLVGLATTLLFSLWPAVRATRIDVAPHLKQGGVIAGRERSHGGRLLTLVQVSLSIVLLVAAGLFLRSLRNLRQLDLGLRAERLIQLDFDPRAAGYRGDACRLLCRRLLARAAAVPGVQDVTLSQNGLFSGWESATSDWNVPGYVSRASGDQRINQDVVGPGYFSTLGIRVLAGRDFGPQDSEAASKALVINDDLARFYFPDDNAVGQRVSIQGIVWEIIGVVRDARDHQLREPPKRRFYIPFFQAGRDLQSVRLLIRTFADPEPVMSLLRQTVRAEDPRLPVVDVNSVPALINRQLVIERMIATLSGYFALLAVLVAAIGLHGVLSHQVVQRTREIGVRVALGALRRQVIWAVTRESLLFVAAGIVIGLSGAFALSRVVVSLLFELKPADPLSMVAAVGALALAALPAALIPAVRAARLDPARILREE
jgi:predicted permease